MKCKHCGYETDSEKIYYTHEENCLKIQEENGIINKTPNNDDPPKTGYEALVWNELKKIAASKGIEVKGKKKDDILQALKVLDDEQVNLQAQSNPEDDQNDNNSRKGENNPTNNNNG